jgi:hypothetical protein
MARARGRLSLLCTSLVVALPLPHGAAASCNVIRADRTAFERRARRS